MSPVRRCSSSSLRGWPPGSLSVSWVRLRPSRRPMNSLSTRREKTERTSPSAKVAPSHLSEAVSTSTRASTRAGAAQLAASATVARKSSTISRRSSRISASGAKMQILRLPDRSRASVETNHPLARSSSPDARLSFLIVPARRRKRRRRRRRRIRRKRARTHESVFETTDRARVAIESCSLSVNKTRWSARGDRSWGRRVTRPPLARRACPQPQYRFAFRSLLVTLSFPVRFGRSIVPNVLATCLTRAPPTTRSIVPSRPDTSLIHSRTPNVESSIDTAVETLCRAAARGAV